MRKSKSHLKDERVERNSLNLGRRIRLKGFIVGFFVKAEADARTSSTSSAYKTKGIKYRRLPL